MDNKTRKITKLLHSNILEFVKQLDIVIPKGENPISYVVKQPNYASKFVFYQSSIIDELLETMTDLGITEEDMKKYCNPANYS